MLSSEAVAFPAPDAGPAAPTCPAGEGPGAQTRGEAGAAAKPPRRTPAAVAPSVPTTLATPRCFGKWQPAGEPQTAAEPKPAARAGMGKARRSRPFRRRPERPAVRPRAGRICGSVWGRRKSARQKTTAVVDVLSFGWRRGGDSNPRHRFCQCNCLAGSPVRPLQHLSKADRVCAQREIVDCTGRNSSEAHQTLPAENICACSPSASAGKSTLPAPARLPLSGNDGHL